MVLEYLVNELVGLLGKREGIEPPTPTRKPTCTVEEVKDDKDENTAFMNTGKDSMFGDMKKYSSQ